ncbi:MAG TPA: TetR/AcrR family transcriptional regulator [Thermoleophilaceae bacterium]|nr:TetR/AcrR family transcriptional regulator [Thermoleophilaceae bacterium]
MTVTPWGRSERLRSRQLPPGPRTDKRSVERNQRERLFAATVAVGADKGYEAMTVGDLIELAGVSRSAFYRLFSNKCECFLATLDALLEMAGPWVLDVYHDTPGPWDRRLRAMLEALGAIVVAQPAAARVAWVEVYAAGPAAVERIERLDEQVEAIVREALRESPEHADAPPAVVHAVIGGLHRMIHTRLREGREAELPELMPQLLEWMLTYRTPPEELLRPDAAPARLEVRRPPAEDRRRRILYALTDLVAEAGYTGVTITQIADRAGVSLTTFYEHFDGKEEAFLATLADAQQRLLEATLAPYLEAESWVDALAAAARAFFDFLATDPMTAHFGGVEVWSAGPAGFDLRARGLASFTALLDQGFREYPDTPPIAAEAIGASVDALLFDQLRRKGAESVYEVVPTVGFLTFAPFVGAERACRLANAAAVPVEA